MLENGEEKAYPRQMDDKIIERLFEQVAQSFDTVPEDAKKFFTMFVQETLKYRDELNDAGENPLKVEEVQEALTILEDVVKKNAIVKDVSERSMELVNRWLRKLS
jgi:hypothetical protein